MAIDIKKVMPPVKRPEPTFTESDPKTPAAGGTCSPEEFKKFQSVKGRLAGALFRAKTGIGVDKAVLDALNEPMPAAALMFIKDPSLACTEEGAQKLYTLMAEVAGFTDLAEGGK